MAGSKEIAYKALIRESWPSIAVKSHVEDFSQLLSECFRECDGLCYGSR